MLSRGSVVVESGLGGDLITKYSFRSSAKKRYLTVRPIPISLINKLKIRIAPHGILDGNSCND